MGHVWAGSDYFGVVQQLVKKLKFERAIAAAEVMTTYLAKNLPEFPAETLLVPVPTAANRVRQRGYDQAELLTKALANDLRLSKASVLIRIGKTRQVGTKRTERLKQLDQAFQVRLSAKVQGANIILVDDVLTTGATLEAAAKALRRAGAKHVDAIVFAQA